MIVHNIPTINDKIRKKVGFAILLQDFYFILFFTSINYLLN